MKLIIFAGGSGKRFWPISRDNLPKQFVKIQNNASTLQLAIKRIQPVYGWHNIYISTNEKYVTQVKEEIPQISISNIFTEPARRDVGPAVGLALIRLKKLGVKEPVFIGWADHLIKKEEIFQEKLKEAEQAIMKNKHKIILWGETPKFANANIGWIQISKHEKSSVHAFKDFVYRPKQERCEELFKSKNGLWNTGYWISTIDYLLSIYKEFNPSLYKKLTEIEKYLDTEKEAEVIEKLYPELETISFDDAVAYHLPKQDVGVLESNMGWEDPGTLYALKRSYENNDNNYIKGQGIFKDSIDSMIFNEEKKFVVALNLKEQVIVNTKDVILITNKDGMQNIKGLLAEFEKSKKYKKYL